MTTERIVAVIKDDKIVNTVVIAHDAILKANEIELDTIVGAVIGDTIVDCAVSAVAVRVEAAHVADVAAAKLAAKLAAAELVTATANEALRKSAEAKLAALGLTADEIAAL